MKVDIGWKTIEDYELFMRIRKLPAYEFRGGYAYFPDHYTKFVNGCQCDSDPPRYSPSSFLFDYQAAISRMAIARRKFAVFADCGLGKTLILLEFARHAMQEGLRTLIVSPLMVCNQTISESMRWYNDSPTFVPASRLQAWLDGDGKSLAITNYESIRQGLRPGTLGALILDESSMMKSQYGKFGTRLISLGRGLKYKLCLTGTPAPNDRVEYGNHAVFLDAAKTLNEFLAKYFVNRGETANRWEIMPHAIGPFYRDMSHWCIFLSDPSVYGWSGSGKTIPPINVHIIHIEMTSEQRNAVQRLTGRMFVPDAGGIGQRAKLYQIGKGYVGSKRIATNKPSWIADNITNDDRSTLVWCRRNAEQDDLATMIPDNASIDGSTPIERRIELIDAFKSGQVKALISKPKILGFGLNLQVCTKQIFSGIQDSYEEYYQAVKRSNRYGSVESLDVYMPVTEPEEPMMQNVLRKAARIAEDTAEQERVFRKYGFTMES